MEKITRFFSKRPQPTESIKADNTKKGNTSGFFSKFKVRFVSLFRTKRLYTVDNSNSKPLQERTVAVAVPNRSVRIDSPSNMTQQFCEKILQLKPENNDETTAWIQELKLLIPEAKTYIESQGKEVTTDLLMAACFRQLHFTQADLPVLKHLLTINQSDNIVNSLKGYMALKIIEDIGFNTTKPADQIANSDPSHQSEAIEARKQFLLEESWSDKSLRKTKSILTQLSGRPYDQRQQLEQLKEGIQQLNPLKNKYKKLIQKINHLMDNERKKKNLLEVNKLVNTMKTNIEKDALLRAHFTNWPNVPT